jgi:hypothetical protein
MEVGICGQDILVAQTIPFSMDTMSPPHIKGQSKPPLLPIRDVGVMKLMTVKDLPCGEIRIRRINLKDCVPVTLRTYI